jgi:hypothetical protein
MIEVIIEAAGGKSLLSAVTEKKFDVRHRDEGGENGEGWRAAALPWLAPFSDQRSAAALPAAYLVGVWRSLELLGRTYRGVRFLYAACKG